MGILEKRKELRKQQIPPSRNKAIAAMCRGCMAEYIDGRMDCEIPTCPLYYWMPYRENLASLDWNKKQKDTKK
jgi:hypothetical protein